MRTQARVSKMFNNTANFSSKVKAPTTAVGQTLNSIMRSNKFNTGTAPKKQQPSRCRARPDARAEFISRSTPQPDDC